MNRIVGLLIFVMMTDVGGSWAEETDVTVKSSAEGSVTPEAGLAAWDRIYKVVSHPRCSNCHVGPDNVPMWSGPSFGKTRAHGMNVKGGESRIGMETIPCSTCHTTSSAGNDRPHAAPRVNLPWRLAPVEFQWFGKSSAEICAQLSDPERNGGRDANGLAEHLRDDATHGGFVQWGWNPGGNRAAAPRSLQEHINDVLAWGAAGMPCPSE
jgi:hypothetical protein